MGACCVESHWTDTKARVIPFQKTTTTKNIGPGPEDVSCQLGLR